MAEKTVLEEIVSVERLYPLVFVPFVFARLSIARLAASLGLMFARLPLAIG